MSPQDAETFIRRWLDDHGLNRTVLSDTGILMTVIAAYGVECARQERERCEAIATRRASEWRAILSDHPESVAAWHEACDIAALINKPDWDRAGASPGGRG